MKTKPFNNAKPLIAGTTKTYSGVPKLLPSLTYGKKSDAPHFTPQPTRRQSVMVLKVAKLVFGKR